MNLKTYAQKMVSAIMQCDADDVENLEVCVSTGNTKIGKVLNVSLPAVFSCMQCKHCAKECYDVRDCRYTNTLKARARNWSIVTRSPEKYFSDIRRAIEKHPSFRYFRWHVGGDIPNLNYFAEVVAIAREYPNVRFWTYTKVYGLVNEYVRTHGGSIAEAIPENMSVMFSEWRGFRMDNPYGFAEFKAYYDDETVPSGIMECTGNCRICEEKGIGCPYRKTVWTRIRGQKKGERRG